MNNIRILNSNTIKVFAIIAMTIDHIAWAVFPGYPYEILPVLMHIIGRITCPVMCYFIAEGYHHTKNINRYTVRLFLFALISHFPYMLNFGGYVDWKTFIPFFYGNITSQTSVIWSLAWGLVMLRVVNSPKIKRRVYKIVLILLICVITLSSDWSCVASLCVLAIGINRGKFKNQMLWMTFFVFVYSVVYFFVFNKVYAIIQMCVVLSVPLLMMYNGERGKNPRVNKFMKWFFYTYYPLHLFVIGIIKII